MTSAAVAAQLSHIQAALRPLASAATTTLGEVATREMFRPLTLPDIVSFQAGHETSATAMLWWSRLLAEHPDVEQGIHEELDQVLGRRDPQPEDLPFLVFLGASLKEAMRMYPPIAAIMTRRTTRAIRLGGWHVPRGSLLRITPWVWHCDPRWYQEPDAFEPERFLTDAPQHPRGAWMPFGTGPPVCIGQHFATLEMTLIGAMLLQRYRLALPPDAPKYCEPVCRFLQPN